jgi:hypothetical protein
MRQIEHFVPGELDEDEGILQRLRWSIPAGVTQAYVEAYTDPREVVLIPYCQGPAVVRETTAMGRRAVAFNFDAAVILAVQATLSPPPLRELNAAVARLGDSPKQGQPLYEYLTDLYATSCPACLRPAVADYFVWDREGAEPIAKHLRCPACGWDGQTAIDMEDKERLAQVPARGMHYHYVLDRVAPGPPGDAARTRLEQLLELYSPRNLYALAELTLKIESIFSDGPTRQALRAMLLDCLDRCSSLTPLPSRKVRRRGLGRPSRFIERNVWHAFEEAIARLASPAEQPVPAPVNTLEAFSASGKADTFVGQGLIRDLSRAFQPRSIRLILTSPPPLDSAAWSLAYLWGAWLLGAEAVAPLRPLLRQRTPDPVWYARAMASSLRTLGSLLRDDGRLVLVLTGQRPAVVEALLLASSSARLATASLVQSGADYRLELSPVFPQPFSISAEALQAKVQRTATETAIETIQLRGEPVPWRTVHVAIQRQLAHDGLLSRALEADPEGLAALVMIAAQVRQGLNAPMLLRLPAGEKHEELWWLANPGNLASPLSDRVELAAYEVLQEALATSELDFAEALHKRFLGPLTSSADLIAACLHAYGREPAPGYWQLRTEDLPETREAERQTIVEHLTTLGQRLGYRIEGREPFDMAWIHPDLPAAVFVIRWHAALHEALELTDEAAGAHPYLVIPGGRAALVSHKLSQNPVWQLTVEEAGWRFIKYRHVRRLVSQPEVDEYALRTIVGLDPIVEREGAQLPLF